jgi:DNA invertase Pin-like site-specific DNA recombinase
MSKHYGYISFMKNPRISDESKADNVSLDEQRRILEAKTKGGFTYVYSEADASTGHVRSSSTISRPAFDILISTLQKGDVVHIYSWFCLIIGSQMQRMSIDICNTLAKIHDAGASVCFVKEQISTTTPQGKLTITNLIASAQYDYDVSVSSGQNDNNTVAVKACSGGNHC